MFRTKSVFVLLCKGPCCLTSDSNTSLPNVFLSLLQEFEDIFPEDILSGFPPLRGIEHQIDFLPATVIPNRLAYLTNPTEIRNLKTSGLIVCKRTCEGKSKSLFYSRHLGSKKG